MPVNIKLEITPKNAALVLRIVIIRGFVEKFGVLGKHHESVGKSFTQPDEDWMPVLILDTPDGLGIVGTAFTSIKDKAAEPAAAPSAKADHSGSVEERLARLEDSYAKNAEALDFLNKVYAQQKAQQQAQEREEPAPDAMFAVDIGPDVKAGQVEGSPQALITIVEAWDFA